MPITLKFYYFCRRKTIDMTAFFYAIADFFGAIFKILPHLGPFLNTIFIILGVIANFFWLRYMIQGQNEEKGFNS